MEITRGPPGRVEPKRVSKLMQFCKTATASRSIYTVIRTARFPVSR